MLPNTFASLVHLAAALDRQGQHRQADHLDRLLTCRTCTASSVVNNVYNALSNFWHAAGGNTAALLSTMRLQADNLAEVIRTAQIAADQKQLLVELIGEVQAVLGRYNPAFAEARTLQSRRTPGTGPAMSRTASEQSAISTNAKAALGAMAYLQDERLFPGGSMMYPLIARNLTQIFRLMDGDYSVADIRQVRQQQNASTATATSSTAWGNSPPSSAVHTPVAPTGSGAWAESTAAPTQTVPYGSAGVDPYVQLSTFPKPGTPGYSEPEHIGRYVDYGRQYGYDAMVRHLKQHEGDLGFMQKVKNAWAIRISEPMFQTESAR